MADARHRLAMLWLAVAPYPELVIDTREIDSQQQNYTLWTLQSLRAEQPDAALLWIIGEDAFAQLPGWYRWQELFDAAHFVVINRGGTNPCSSSAASPFDKPPPAFGEFPLSKEGKTGARREQDWGEAGVKSDALPEILQKVVASRLTEDKHALTSRSAGLVCHLTLPPQPASGTQIRAALAVGCADTITDLLPASVLAYIARHALYQVKTHGS
jgi:nicotinate-nucleotide adenylyltransferase